MASITAIASELQSLALGNKDHVVIQINEQPTNDDVQEINASFSTLSPTTFATRVSSRYEQMTLSRKMKVMMNVMQDTKLEVRVIRNMSVHNSPQKRQHLLNRGGIVKNRISRLVNLNRYANLFIMTIQNLRVNNNIALQHVMNAVNIDSVRHTDMLYVAERVGTEVDQATRELSFINHILMQNPSAKVDTSFAFNQYVHDRFTDYTSRIEEYENETEINIL